MFFLERLGRFLHFQLQGNLKTFSMDVQQCSRQSLKKTVSCYHVVSAIVEGILALCEEVSVMSFCTSAVSV